MINASTGAIKGTTPVPFFAGQTKIKPHVRKRPDEYLCDGNVAAQTEFSKASRAGHAATAV